MSVLRDSQARESRSLSPQAAARRESVLEAALATTSRKGFHETSIADIAKRARASRATVYQYFADKRAILGAIGQRVEKRIIGAVDADLATQDPLGPLGSFDPTTGVGSVVAPNLTPGPYPVVATCVGPSLNLDVLEAGIRDTGDFLRSIGLTDEICNPNIPEFAEFIEEFLGSGADLFVFLETIGPTVVQNIPQFDALGIQVFTILAQPAERIADLIEDIDALVAGGQLKANQARGIVQHLTNALRKLEKGKLGPACAQLDAFTKVVNAKVKAKALDPAAAPALIAEAESIQEQLGCGVGGSPNGAFLDGSEGNF